MGGRMNEWREGKGGGGKGEGMEINLIDELMGGSEG